MTDLISMKRPRGFIQLRV